MGNWKIQQRLDWFLGNLELSVLTSVFCYLIHTILYPHLFQEIYWSWVSFLCREIKVIEQLVMTWGLVIRSGTAEHFLWTSRSKFLINIFTSHQIKRCGGGGRWFEYKTNECTVEVTDSHLQQLTIWFTTESWFWCQPITSGSL